MDETTSPRVRLLIVVFDERGRGYAEVTWPSGRGLSYCDLFSTIFPGAGSYKNRGLRVHGQFLGTLPRPDVFSRAGGPALLLRNLRSGLGNCGVSGSLCEGICQLRSASRNLST